MIIGAPKVSDFQPLKKEEVDALINQINEAFSQGVPAQETVSFPAFILAQLLATVKFLGESQAKPEIKSMDELLAGLSDEEKTETLDTKDASE
jgi:hypothetical protein